MALPINFLHHPLPSTQTKTNVTFGCAYFIPLSWQLYTLELIALDQSGSDKYSLISVHKVRYRVQFQVQQATTKQSFTIWFMGGIGLWSFYTEFLQ
jgi:hypothetical protein